MLRFAISLLVFGLFVTPAAGASLYTGEVPVEREAQAGAAEQLAALDVVLARLTGDFNRSLVSELGLSASDVTGLILSQQLVRRSVVNQEGEREDSLRLQVDFDEPSINQLLRRNRLPHWGTERPAVLLWAVIEDEEDTRFVENARLEWFIADQARRLGLEVVRPLRDAMDLTEMSLQDVRGGFLGSATESARRYGAGVIAMLDLRLEDPDPEQPRWSGRWRWRIEQQDSSYSHSAERPEALIRGGLQRIASALGARYAVLDLDGESARWQVTVSGIADEVQYAEVLRYMNNLSVVEDLQVVSAKDRQISFEVFASGQDLETYLALSGLLEMVRREGERALHLRLAP